MPKSTDRIRIRIAMGAIVIFVAFVAWFYLLNGVVTTR